MNRLKREFRKRRTNRTCRVHPRPRESDDDQVGNLTRPIVVQNSCPRVSCSGIGVPIDHRFLHVLLSVASGLAFPPNINTAPTGLYKQFGRECQMRRGRRVETIARTARGIGVVDGETGPLLQCMVQRDAEIATFEVAKEAGVARQRSK